MLKINLQNRLYKCFGSFNLSSARGSQAKTINRIDKLSIESRMRNGCNYMEISANQSQPLSNK